MNEIKLLLQLNHQNVLRCEGSNFLTYSSISLRDLTGRQLYVMSDSSIGDDGEQVGFVMSSEEASSWC